MKWNFHKTAIKNSVKGPLRHTRKPAQIPIKWDFVITHFQYCYSRSFEMIFRPCFADKINLKIWSQKFWLTFLTDHSAYQKNTVLRILSRSLLLVLNDFVKKLFIQLSECVPALKLSAITSVSDKLSNPLSAFLLRLRFCFGWPLCAFTNYIYLLTYLRSLACFRRDFSL